MNSGVAISIILCCHNPKGATLSRVLAAIECQSLPQEQWELIIVDNASNPPVQGRGFQLPSNSRLVVENELGLTSARICGIRAAKAPIIILIDDDTVPSSDYLEVALALLQRHPEIGAAGGRIMGDFAHPPPAWARHHLDLLAVRDFGNKPIRALVYNEGGPWEPCGAGMVVRAEVARHYVAQVRTSGRRHLDRKGTTLSSCGDTDLARGAADMGFYLAYDPTLALTHIIPANRLTLSYLTRLAYSIHRDAWLLMRLRGRKCDLAGPKLFAKLALAPLQAVALDPRTWLLRAASAFGQIKGRSIPVEDADGN